MFSSIPNIVFILIVSVVQNIFILARFTEFLIIRIKPVWYVALLNVKVVFYISLL